MKRATDAELREMTSDELEEQANLLLYGQPKAPMGSGRAIVDSWGKPHAYPKYLLPKKSFGTCSNCKRPRAAGSARRCRACYLAEAQRKRSRRELPLEAPEMAIGEEGEKIIVYRDYNEHDR